MSSQGSDQDKVDLKIEMLIELLRINLFHYANMSVQYFTAVKMIIFR